MYEKLPIVQATTLTIIIISIIKACIRKMDSLVTEIQWLNLTHSVISVALVLTTSVQVCYTFLEKREVLQI